MRKKNLLAILLIVISTHSFAKASILEFSASIVATHQSASKSYIEDESAASADLIFHSTTNSGQWLTHIEANSTPNYPNGVSSILPGVNGDIGSALNQQDEGRIQVSQFYYSHKLPKDQTITFGMLDVSGFFEQSRIASDETTQFLGAPFTSNVTIGFPDYTLGLIHEKGMSNNVFLRSAVASSNGLADNPNRTYSQLFNVVDNDKGIFGIVSASWSTKNWLVRAGSWLNTANYSNLDNTSNKRTNYGAYILAGQIQRRHSANVRLGVANPEVNRSSAIASVAYSYNMQPYTIGTAVGHSFLSPRETTANLNDTSHYEVFLRYSLQKDLLLTADIQGVNNSNNGTTPLTRDEHINLFGIRLTWLYN